MRLCTNIPNLIRKIKATVCQCRDGVNLLLIKFKTLHSLALHYVVFLWDQCLSWLWALRKQQTPNISCTEHIED